MGLAEKKTICDYLANAYCKKGKQLMHTWLVSEPKSDLIDNFIQYLVSGMPIPKKNLSLEADRLFIRGYMFREIASGYKALGNSKLKLFLISASKLEKELAEAPRILAS